MKTQYSLLLALTVITVNVALSQIKYTDYKSLAKANLDLLDKDKKLADNRVVVDDLGIKLKTGIKIDFYVAWPDVPKLVDRLESSDPYKLIEAFTTGGEHKLQRILREPVAIKYKQLPVTLDSLVIGIDPGHFASDFKEAIMEEKYVKIKGSDLGLKKDVKFYEAELNDFTALALENKLLAAGAKPFRTKGLGGNSIGKNFTHWYASEFKGDLLESYKSGLITKRQYETLPKSDSLTVFHLLYKQIELRKRIDLINQNVPALTVCVHYNAHENSKRNSDGYLPVVKENYSMAFVPGAFLWNELERPSVQLDFLRLLLSPDLDKSKRLAHLILEKERELMGISQVPTQNIALDERYCTYTLYDGVYARNLALTRTVRGSVVYLEVLLQDNDIEALNLAKRDFEINHSIYGKLKIPKRCEEVAESIYQGILQWIEENKVIASTKH